MSEGGVWSKKNGGVGGGFYGSAKPYIAQTRQTDTHRHELSGSGIFFLSRLKALQVGEPPDRVD